MNSTSLVRMSVLARLSGVPAATIKHYIREGLLARPGMTKTSRNMTWYDPSLAERIRTIKALQREHFLPLKVIKSILDGDRAAEASAAIERTLDTMALRESRTRAQLVAGGLPEKELALFEALGVVTPRKVDGEETFAGDDLALLRLLGEARRAGITREMLPPEILEPYMRAINELVRVELELFRQGILPNAGKDLARVTDAATRLSERLVVLVRRKLLLPTLRELVAVSRDPKPASRTPRGRARRASRGSTRRSR